VNPKKDNQPRTVFDYVNSVGFNKQYIFDESSEKEYIPFIVNRNFSYFIDTVLYANEVNKYSSIDKQAQYDFYFHSLRSKRRFSKWVKKINNPDIQLICKYYRCNVEQAKIAMTILSKEQIKHITEYWSDKNE